MTPAVDVRDAFRIHRSAGGTAVALQGLSLRVEAGETVVVLGPSGSGKTTLLRAVAGFDSLSAGSVQVLGRDLGGLGPAALARFRASHLGLLDQHYARALSPDLTCVHSVALGLELLGTPRREARAAAASLLERVGLGDRLGDRPGTLSGGEQQRVALCAALVHRPPLLLADEPAGELDRENARTVYALVAELVREHGAAALVVSHDEAAAAIADRLVHVRDGRVVEESRPGEPRALVVTEPGWIRIPDPLLEAIGEPRRLYAELRGRELALGALAGPARLGEQRRGPAQPRPSQPAAAAAEVRGLTKRFPAAARPVLDRLSRRFAAGTFTAVVGRSGSGKTTLLHLLAGLDRPDAGEVIVQGREIGRLGRADVAAVRRDHVALVTQEPGLVPHLSARENVELGLQVRGAGGDAAAALREVGLGARLDHRADRLSAGERQRVAIARALAVRPALLLADEPTARLDNASAREVGDLLARFARETGAAVICATHDEALIERAGDAFVLQREPPEPAAAPASHTASA
ncbi:MAG TPA: ATP-binding cassette domain-containing protein [Gaiellaceae bacterium]|nr:ATP-binding cassette domain-containing protein [Gaiellaceae bacterium]